MRTPPIFLALVASQHHGQLPMSTVACAGAANANEHLARAGIGLSDLVECSSGVDLGRTADQLECLHGNPRRQSNV